MLLVHHDTAVAPFSVRIEIHLNNFSAKYIVANSSLVNFRNKKPLLKLSFP